MASVNGERLSRLNQMLVGYDRALGLRFVGVSEGELTATIEISEVHKQPFGLVHGGVYCGLVETLGSVAAQLDVEESGRRVVGVENHTSFLRAARSGTLNARCVPLKRGRRTQVWETHVEDAEGKLLATGRLRVLCVEAEALER